MFSDRNTIHSVAAPLALLLACSACGGGPSEAEKQEQIERQAAVNRETEKLLEELRMQQAALDRAKLCNPLDEEQSQINSSFAQLRSEYPISTGFLIGCLRNAENRDAANGCMLTACIGASMGAQNESSGCMDLGTRLVGLSERQANLYQTRRLPEYSNCEATVRSNFDT